jgi:hypothetical protein
MAEILLAEMYQAYNCCERSYGVSLQQKIDRLNAFADGLMPDLMIYNDLLTKVLAFYESKNAHPVEDPAPQVTLEERAMILEWETAADELETRMEQHRDNCGILFGRTYGAFRSWILILHIVNERRDWAIRRNLVAFADSAFNNGSMPSALNELMLIEISKVLVVKHPFCLGVFDDLHFPFDQTDNEMNTFEPELHENDYPLTGVGDLTDFIYELLHRQPPLHLPH